MICYLAFEFFVDYGFVSTLDLSILRYNMCDDDS